MVNQLLLWLVGIPITLGIVVWWFLKDRIRDAYVPGIAVGVLGCLILAGSFYGSAAVATSDYELWNGQTVSKKRFHDTYEEAYDCMCTSDKDGRTTCQTCYRTHYTVEWTFDTTVGEFKYEKKDSTSNRIYSVPDPARWASIQPGEPVAKRNRYTNYVQAVPNSLFAPSAAELNAEFKSLLPAYPDNVYDLYRVDRFLSPGLSVPDAKEWSQDISMMLRQLGPKKQVNLIVVVAKTDNPDFEYALRNHWEGVNKNDVVVLIGAKEYPKIDFVRVITWSKVELFKIELRDNIQALGNVERAPVLGLIQTQINKNFERRHMAEFKYLEAEIDPPVWVVMGALIANVLIAAGVFGYLVGWFEVIGLRRPYGLQIRQSRFR